MTALGVTENEGTKQLFEDDVTIGEIICAGNPCTEDGDEDDV